ncbi:ABC transporter ATP-binding protein [Algibacter sp. 2305UL17-15]|uniref:ABC transporter ATP-binding protein n=1 Tax=Algibacter sp. 2305UL17-15 TaxID=3231268 RepID=UPI00345B0670
MLSGVYLKAETGKVTGTLGSNGCGKSRLLNIAFGNLKAKYQLVRVDSKPILKPLYQTNLAALLPQSNFIPNQMKLKSAFNHFKVNWDDFMNRFKGLRISKDIRFNRLSGGERRLIETYIILKSDKKIIFLDEPFSHLAPLHIETIKTIISEEKQRKVIVITDHMFRHIVAISDSIYLLKNGCTKLIDELSELEDYRYLSAGSL